jgi:hypothetical protein
MKINLHFFSRTLFLPIFFIFILPANSCSPTGPADNSNITLTLEDVSCTEVWIKLTTQNLQLPAEINLIRTDPDGGSVSKISILKTPYST